MSNKHRQPATPSGSDQRKPEQIDPNNVQQARKEAERDIDNDAETSASSPNDDLDEGELARLGESPEGIV